MSRGKSTAGARRHMIALLLLGLLGLASVPGTLAGLGQLDLHRWPSHEAAVASPCNNAPAMVAGQAFQNPDGRREELQAETSTATETSTVQSTGQCAILPGFEFHPQQDTKDRSLASYQTGPCTVSENVTAAWEQCSKDPACKSFSFFKGVKGNVYCLNYEDAGTFFDRAASYMPDPCHGTYVQVNCFPAPDGYTFYKSTLLQEARQSDGTFCANVTDQTTMSQLVTTCKQQNPDCQSFSYFVDGTVDQVYCFKSAGPVFTIPSAVLPAGKCYGSYTPSTPSIPWLQQWGGQIMADTVNVYMIYVGAYAATDKVPTTLNYFVDNVEQSDWWRAVTRFWMGSQDSPTYASGALALAGSYFIPTTSDMNLPGVDITADVFASVKYLIDNGQVPWDPKQGLYVVVPKSGQYKALASCADADSCGWHSAGSFQTNDTNWSQMKFALVPDAGCAVGCAPKSDPAQSSFVSEAYTNLTSPTGSDYVDGLVSTLAHELVEAATDPFLDAWTTVQGPSGENGDLCRGDALAPGTYTTASGNKVFYNALVGGKPYLVQLTYDPTVIPGSSPAKQYGCVYGVNRAGVTMTLDQGLPALSEGSLPASPPRPVRPPPMPPTSATAPPLATATQPPGTAMSPPAPPSPKSMAAMPVPSLLLWAVAGIIAAMCVMLS